MKIIALCCFRNASNYLPGFVSNLEPYVDSFMFIDDRSLPFHSKASRDILGDCEKASVLLNRAGRTEKDFRYEVRNRQILIREAIAEAADWLLCLDADERVETTFLRNMRKVIENQPNDAYSLRVRDIWNRDEQYRVDGIWGTKTKPVLFDANNPDALMGIKIKSGLHQPWIRTIPPTPCEANLYHLGSLTPDLRFTRVERHEAEDPKNEYQQDYKYLADETGLKLEQIPPGRGYC